MRLHVISLLMPGIILTLLGVALIDVSESVAISIALIGVLVLIGWPITAAVIGVRLNRCRRRDEELPPGLAKAQSFVEAVTAITMIFVLPVVILGGLSAFCLITAADDPEDSIFKTIVGFAALLLLVAYLSIVAFGRSSLTLRFIGVAVLIFGVICVVGTTQEFIDGEAGRRSGTGFIGGVLMSICGLWLTITGRNIWSRK